MIDATEFVGVGYENRTSRDEVVQRTGLPDRVARESLKSGYNVVIWSNGYFVPTEQDERYVRQYLASMYSRVNDIVATCKRIESATGVRLEKQELPGQIRLEDIFERNICVKRENTGAGE